MPANSRYRASNAASGQPLCAFSTGRLESASFQPYWLLSHTPCALVSAAVYASSAPARSSLRHKPGISAALATARAPSS